MEQTEKLRQPKGLWLLSFTAIWERFSYYGMRAFLILYMADSMMNKGLGFDEKYAGYIYGTFAMLCYVLSLPGGYLADRYLGKRKSVIIGGILIIIGQFTLALNINADVNLITFFTGLAILALGNGFFKPNCSSMIGDLYEPGDKRRDSGFSLFYTLFNGGAGLAPIVCGYFSETFDYHYGFLIAGCAMVLGLIVYLFTAKKYLGDIGKLPVHKQNTQNVAEKKPLTKEEKQRIIVIFILVFFVIFFWAGFEQAGSTLNIYTKKYIDKSIFGWEMPTTWFQAINPALILVFGSSFAALWLWLAKKRRNPSTPTKMGLGMIALGLGFFFMVGAVLSRGINCQDDTVKASFMWIIATYLFHTIGELCLSPIGLSMITKLAPPRRTSLFMGIWFAGIGVALFLSGTVLDIVSKIGAFNVFLSIGIFICLLGVIMLLLSKKLIRMMHGVD